MTTMHKPEAPICAGPDLNTRKTSFTLPSNATDCYTHVFGAREQYGYADERQYTPPPGFLKDYLAMLDAVAFACGVVAWHTQFLTVESGSPRGHENA